MPGWVSDLIFDIIFWVGIPGLFIVSAGAPFFVVKKILKRRFTPSILLISVICAIGLVALDIYALYWGIQILGSLAVMELYGS